MCFSPSQILGKWDEGYVMDYHSKHSEIIGEDAFGHFIYNTERTTLGELVFQLKYRNNYPCAEEIINIIGDFILDIWEDKVNYILPIPPTKNREVQPVFLIAELLAKLLDCNTSTDVLSKTNDVQSKNLCDKSQLSGTIVQNRFSNRKIDILLVDDLYSSGTTANECVSILRHDPNIGKIYYLAITKTKSR